LRRSLNGPKSLPGRFGEERKLYGHAGIRTYVPVGNRRLILLLSAFVSLIFLSPNLFIACNIDARINKKLLWQRDAWSSYLGLFSPQRHVFKLRIEGSSECIE
jgi:uncharacterized membrane protein